MDYRTYASPFSWRYGRAALRALFSERTRRRLWRCVWVALAEAQSAEGFGDRGRTGRLKKARVGECHRHRGGACDRARDSSRSDGRNPRLRGAGGARRRQAAVCRRDLDGHRRHGRDLPARLALSWLGEKSGANCCARLPNASACMLDLVCMGFTHLQPAVWMMLGYRLAVYAQDLLIDDANLRFVFENVTTKGLGEWGGHRRLVRGFVDGSGRSSNIEAFVLEQFGLEAREISTQTYPRKPRSPLALRARRFGRVALEVRLRRARRPAARSSVKPPSRSAARRSEVRRCRSSVTRSSASESFAGAPAGRVQRHRLAERGDESFGTDALLQRQPPHDSSRSAACAPTRLIALAHRVVAGLRVDERRIAQNLRTYGLSSGNRSGDDGSGALGAATGKHCTNRCGVPRWKRGRPLARGQDNPLSRLLAEDPHGFLLPLRRSRRDPAAARSRQARGNGASTCATAGRSHRTVGAVPKANGNRTATRGRRHE